MTDLLTAIALAIALEGALYALFPEAMKKFMLQILDQPDTALRRAGLTAVIAGVALVWLVRS
ncbi:MAG: DUF2065 domain-containing protein [Rhodospirillaceae bacterium]|jgi:uncharacterized protein|nr:DUF2065 domain-containing protein [Rhodospirillaceae bacterium]MBT7266885.1 DUF2065 domain-containing protein [Rhodospirillaceae bacterium]